MQGFRTTMNGEDITLAITFDAADEISERVHDLFAIAREAVLDAQFVGRGIPYQPRFALTVKNVAQIIEIGLRQAGDKRKAEDVRALIMAHGLMETKSIALEYIARLTTPTAEEKLAESKKADAGN